MIWSSGAYGAHFGSLLQPKSAKSEPNGGQKEPKLPKCPERAPKSSQMATKREPRSPKRRVQGGVQESSRKKDAPPREHPKQMGLKWHNFLSHVAHVGVIFSILFQGNFLIDLFVFFRLIFDGVWVVFSMIYGPCSKTPEPLFFDNSTVR